MVETLLIVDDLEIERESIKALLGDNYTVLEAANGEECLEVMETCQGHIDLVLLDIRMPVLDGFGVLKRRLELDYFRTVPVIVLTGSEDVQDQIKSFELDANDFISKPINPDITKSRINNVLSSSRRLKSLFEEKEEFRLKSELDMMTGIYNKVTTERLSQMMLEKYKNQMHAIMVVDVDNFKMVNDLEGHQVGDHTLRIIADALSSRFRQFDIVGRIGGDEFFVLMTDLPTAEIARKKAQEIIRLMKYKPNLTLPANVSVSIGLAISNREGLDYKELFRRADEALYISKENGRARYTEYGQTEGKLEKDERNVIMLCSRDRMIQNTVANLVGTQYHFEDVISIEELEHRLKKETKTVAVLYDVSTDSDDGKGAWEQISKMKEIGDIPVVALCKEGDMQQYRATLLCDKVQDIINTPINDEILERRLKNLL